MNNLQNIILMQIGDTWRMKIADLSAVSSTRLPWLITQPTASLQPALCCFGDLWPGTSAKRTWSVNKKTAFSRGTKKQKTTHQILSRPDPEHRETHATCFPPKSTRWRCPVIAAFTDQKQGTNSRCQLFGSIMAHFSYVSKFGARAYTHAHHRLWRALFIYLESRLSQAIIYSFFSLHIR